MTAPKRLLGGLFERIFKRKKTILSRRSPEQVFYTEPAQQLTLSVVGNVPRTYKNYIMLNILFRSLSAFIYLFSFVKCYVDGKIKLEDVTVNDIWLLTNISPSKFQALQQILGIPLKKIFGEHFFKGDLTSKKRQDIYLRKWYQIALKYLNRAEHLFSIQIENGENISFSEFMLEDHEEYYKFYFMKYWQEYGCSDKFEVLFDDEM